jgi:hypothetical protein
MSNNADLLHQENTLPVMDGTGPSGYGSTGWRHVRCRRAFNASTAFVQPIVEHPCENYRNGLSTSESQPGSVQMRCRGKAVKIFGGY